MPRRLVPALSPNSELWAFSLPLQTTPIPSEAELVPIAVPPCAAQEGSPMLTQDRHQYEMLRDEGSAYNELTSWYLEHWRESAVEDDLSHWGVTYRTYADEYVKAFASMMILEPGSQVFESAVGAGWLIRAIQESQPEASQGIKWAGNDILVSPHPALFRLTLPRSAAPRLTPPYLLEYMCIAQPEALAVARRDIPDGNFVLGLVYEGSTPLQPTPNALSQPTPVTHPNPGQPPAYACSDSANLTGWAPLNAYDMSICGYIEPSPDALEAAGFTPTAVREWFGNWVRQMCAITKVELEPPLFLFF
jgi:hypothetical protein